MLCTSFADGRARGAFSLFVSQFRDFLSNAPELRRRERAVYLQYEQLRTGLPASFMDALASDPLSMYPAMELALYRHYKALMRSKPHLEFIAEDCLCVLRIVEWPVTGLKHVKAHCIGRLLCVAGTVIRASGIRPRVVSVAFRCVRCTECVTRTLDEGKYVPPTSCITPQCRS